MTRESSRQKQQRQQDRSRFAVTALLLIVIAAAYGIATLQRDSEARQTEQLKKMRAISDIAWDGQLAAMKLTKIEAKYRASKGEIP